MKSMEKRWLAEDDARTLARYQEIMMDNKRKNAAIRQARQQASNLEKQASAMKLAAEGKLKRK